VLWVCLGAASASGEERALVRAEKFFAALEFDAASAAFQDALLEPGTREERLRAYKGLALSEAFMGQSKRAQAHFETLLTLDPNAEVSSSLGPKIRKPFNAALKKVRKLNLPRPVLKVERIKEGHVEAVLEDGPSLMTEVVVYVRQPGEKAFKETVGPATEPLLVPAPAVRAVEAYAVARDSAKGILLEQGSAATPLRFDATEEPPPAVVAAQPTPVVRRESRPIPKWPLVVGGVGLAVAAGVVAGVVLAQPSELKLPPADRTGRLP
jgi:tetratricopeptide (TPR) repeat protein